MTDTRSKNMEDKSKEDLIKIIEEQSALLRREQRKRAKLGLTFETPNNRLQKQLDEIQRGERESLGNWDEDISEVVRNNIPYLVKREDKDVITDPKAGTHTLIKGDNFPALLTLYPEYKGKVDVIYIDPPYNTGNKDFIYNDSYVDKENGYRHSTWLSFMARRLLLAQELLSETGVIFVSIDDNEQAHLKMLMDEIFGAGNFITNIVWDGGLKNNSRFVSVGHDYMMTYALNKNKLVEKDVTWREEKKGIPLFKNLISELSEMPLSTEEKQKVLRKWLRDNKTRLDKGLQLYQFIDENGVVFRKDNISAPGGNGAQYEVLHPITKQPAKNPSRGWGYSQDTMNQLIAENKIDFGKDETTVPQFKRFLSNDGANDNQVPRSYFWDERGNANKHLQAILGKGKFDFPKAVNPIKRWIKMVSPKDALVLDFFAGSGTTGHAVAELNAEDDGNRRCILVTDAGKSGNSDNKNMSGNDENGVDIAEDVTYERMRRVLTGEDWANPAKAVALNQNLEMFEVSFLPKAEQGMRKTAFELKMDLEDIFVDLGIDEDLAEIYAERLYNRWEKFAENDKGDLEQWD